MNFKKMFERAGMAMFANTYMTPSSMKAYALMMKESVED